MFSRALSLLVLLSVAAGASLVSAAPPTVWPIGDSITYGFGTSTTPVPGGYRDPLYTDLTNSGKAFKYVGTSTGNPSTTLTNANETNHDGHNGYTIDQIENNLLGNDDVFSNGDNNGGFWLNGGGTTGRGAITPSIILLHIGTNDSSHRTAGQMGADLTNLLDTLKSNRPNALVFVASLIPRTDSSGLETVQQSYNSAIPGIVSGEGSNFHFVDMHAAFKNSSQSLSSLLQSDGVHPTQQGYNLMGTTWFNSIEGYVPEPGSLSILAVGGAGLLGRRRRT